MIELMNVKRGYDLLTKILFKGESNIYQGPEYFKLFLWSAYFRIIGLKPEFLFLKYKFYCVIQKNESGDVVCGFPIKYSKKRKEISFLWDQKSVNNFIYDKKFFTQGCFDDLMRWIFKKFPETSFSMQNIDSKTLLYQYIKESSVISYSESSLEAVDIDISEGYDVWLNGLSKSTKQNLRTAYNRLKKNDLNYHIEHNYGRNSMLLVRKMMYLQRKRNLEKTNRRYSIMTPVLCYIGSWLSMINPRTLMLISCKETFLTTFWIDKSLAAFCAGYISTEGRFFIPFLKYNSSFGRYSPGGIVINECVKKIVTLGKGDLKKFDLMTGSEPYKYTYGGTSYFNWNVMVKPKALA